MARKLGDERLKNWRAIFVELREVGTPPELVMRVIDASGVPEIDPAKAAADKAARLEAKLRIKSAKEGRDKCPTAAEVWDKGGGRGVSTIEKWRQEPKYRNTRLEVVLIGRLGERRPNPQRLIPWNPTSTDVERVIQVVRRYRAMAKKKAVAHVDIAQLENDLIGLTCRSEKEFRLVAKHMARQVAMAEPA